MFDKSALPSERTGGEQTLNQLRDGLSSLTYRMGEIESLLSKKMDRSECLSIIEKKVSFGQLRQATQQIESRLKQQRNEQITRADKMQEISIQKINDLGKKLKEISSKKATKNEAKKTQEKQLLRKILPQQLYIESNQTMFSLLIQEIHKLQQRDDEFQKQLDSRNKKIISLNNQVCAKIEKLQAEIQEKLKVTNQLNDSKLLGNTWSMAQRTNKVTIHKGSLETSQFESFRFDMLSKNIEAIQKELLSKINMKDVIPLIKQNSQPFSQSLEELRQYMQKSMDSTRKILSSQTEINKEISMGVLLGWWHSFEQQHQIAIINQQIINLIPQILQVQKEARPKAIKILQPGLFLVKIHPIETTNYYQNNQEQQSMSEFQLMIGTQVHIVGRQSVFLLQNNSEIRIIQRINRQLVINLQKL